MTPLFFLVGFWKSFYSNHQTQKDGKRRGVMFFMVLIFLAVQQDPSRTYVLAVDPDAEHHPTAEDSHQFESLPLHAESVYHQDQIEDSFLDTLAADPSCFENSGDDCYSPPASTIETETIIDATCFKGGDDVEEENDPITASTNKQCSEGSERVIDKHWGSDPSILAMRDQLRQQSLNPLNDTRSPIFLLPGLASTRLVAWKFKTCKTTGMFGAGTDIKVQDNVWLNINLVIQMGTINVQCMTECLKLGTNQSDADDWENGCKLRPDEGLDAIASLAPGGIGSSLLVGGTNTVYSWLIQWLADNLGYDVTNIIGLPYDWRLSPDKMEARDGFLSMTRRRMEAAVASNGGLPGIVVAHSMGNLVFRYFLDWLREEMREEAYQEYIRRARRREERRKKLRQERETKEENDSSETTSSQVEPQTEMRHPVDTPSVTNDANLNSVVPGWLSATVPGLDAIVNFVSSFSGGESNDEAEVSRYSTADEATDAKGTGERIQPEPAKKLSLDDDLKDEAAHDAQLRELAKEEGDAKWLEWLEKHVWTYIGLSAPMLGAINPLRSVLSGENMGLPITDEIARTMEVTFGSTHTLNPLSTATGFCGEWQADQQQDSRFSSTGPTPGHEDSRLACLDDIALDIDQNSIESNPWKSFPALKAILRDRLDWDKNKPMVDVKIEMCKGSNGKQSCVERETLQFGPKDVENGYIFDAFNSLWKEEREPMIVKREQLEESFMNTKIPNMLNRTWERPLIKHVIMAYGVDIPTEVGYEYSKQIQVDDSEDSGDPIGAESKDNTPSKLPSLKAVVWEEPRGCITVEPIESVRGGLADHFMRKKSKKRLFSSTRHSSERLAHSGDGSVPYLSLAWTHTWLLHAARARRFGQESGLHSNRKRNALDHIHISHRPYGDIDWVDGPPPPEERDLQDPSKLVDTQDTNISHPHGTRYKPLMTRYHNVGKSRTTGIDYTTTIIEAVGVEHKETTRNYDILAAVFSDTLKFMHDDLGLVATPTRKNGKPNDERS